MENYPIIASISEDFFENHPQFTELLDNDDGQRPYVQGTIISDENNDYFVPFRTNGKKSDVRRFPDRFVTLPTAEKPNAALDINKMIILDKEVPISISRRRLQYNDQYRLLTQKQEELWGKVENYVKEYKKFIEEGNDIQEDPRFRFTSLRYFHKELEINEDLPPQKNVTISSEEAAPESSQQLGKLTSLMKEKYGVIRSTPVKFTDKDTLYTSFRKLADNIYKNGEWTQDDYLKAVETMVRNRNGLHVEKRFDPEDVKVRVSPLTEQQKSIVKYDLDDSLGFYTEFDMEAHTKNSIITRKTMVFLDPKNKQGTKHNKHYYFTYSNNEADLFALGNVNRAIGYDKLQRDIIKSYSDHEQQLNDSGIKIEHVERFLRKLTSPAYSAKKWESGFRKSTIGEYTDEFLETLPRFEHVSYMEVPPTKEQLAEGGYKDFKWRDLTSAPESANKLNLEKAPYILESPGSKRYIYPYDVKKARIHNKVIDFIENYIEDTYDIILQQQYESDLEKQTRASAWQTKKNINKETQDIMDSTTLGQQFGYVEIDNDVDLNLFRQFETEMQRVHSTLPKAEHRPDLRLRKLGNYHALGLYHPLANSIAIDFRDYNDQIGGIGIQSFIHEYGHYLDYNKSSDGQLLSMSDNFRPIVKSYRENIRSLPKQSHVVAKSGYYGTPTEVFARAFEIYSSRSGLESSFIKSPEEYETSDEYVIFNDQTIEEFSRYFDQEFPEYKQAILDLNNSIDRQSIESNKDVNQSISTKENELSNNHVEQTSLSLATIGYNPDRKFEKAKLKEFIDKGDLSPWKKNPKIYFVKGMDRVAFEEKTEGEFILSAKFQPKTDKDIEKFEKFITKITKPKLSFEDKIQFAKSRNILEVAEACGMKIEKSAANEYQWSDHPSLKIFPKTNSYRWFSRHESGDTIKMVESVREVPFREAVYFLNSTDLKEVDLKSIQAAAEKREPFNYFLKEHEGIDAAKEYLMNERKLSPETIDIFRNKGVLAEATRTFKGEDAHSETIIVFKYLDGEGKLVGAEQQGIEYLPQYHDRGRLKRLIPNSDGRYGMNIDFGEPKSLVFFEAPIDMMSYYELNAGTEKVQNVRFVSMSGLNKGVVSHHFKGIYAKDSKINSTEYLEGLNTLCLKRSDKSPEEFRKDMKNKGISVSLAVDNDDAGDYYIEDLKESLATIPIFDERSDLVKESNIKDWNDLLKERKVENKEIESIHLRIENHSDGAMFRFYTNEEDIFGSSITIISTDLKGNVSNTSEDQWINDRYKDIGNKIRSEYITVDKLNQKYFKSFVEKWNEYKKNNNEFRNLPKEDGLLTITNEENTFRINGEIFSEVKLTDQEELKEGKLDIESLGQKEKRSHMSSLDQDPEKSISEEKLNKTSVKNHVKISPEQLNEAATNKTRDLISNPDLFEKYLEKIDSFSNLSPRNVALIIEQFPEAKAVATYKQWQNSNDQYGISAEDIDKNVFSFTNTKTGKVQTITGNKLSVKADEHPQIVLLRPDMKRIIPVLDEKGNQQKDDKNQVIYKDLEKATPQEKAAVKTGKIKAKSTQKRDSEGRPSFVDYKVFDISQTNLKPKAYEKVLSSKSVPIGESKVRKGKAICAIHEFGKKMGINICLDESKSISEPSMYLHDEKKVLINANCSEQEKISASIKGLSQAMSKKSGNKNENFVDAEAEITNYLTSKKLGLPIDKKVLERCSDFEKMNDQQLNTALGRIQKNSQALVNAIEDKMKTIKPNNQQVQKSISPSMQQSI